MERENIFTLINLPKWFSFWNFTSSCKNVIRVHLYWVINNGEKEKFWDDAWNGHLPLNHFGWLETYRRDFKGGLWDESQRLFPHK